MFNTSIKTFLAVVQAQNMSRAAEQLNLAQSTVSIRIKVLEQDIGAILIERGKGIKGFRLTSAGKKFVPLAERWLSLMQEIQYIHSDSNRMNLSIGTLDSMNYAVFPIIYRALIQHQPQISLKVVTSHSPDLYNLVDRGQVDVAFTTLQREHPNIIVEKWFTDPMVILRTKTPSHIESELIHPHDLDPNQELYVPWGANCEIWHDKWWDAWVPGRLRLDTFQLILSFLCTDQQWAIVPLTVANEALRKGNFTISRFTEAPPDRICYKIKLKYPKASTVAGLKVLDRYLDLLQQGLL